MSAHEHKPDNKSNIIAQLTHVICVLSVIILILLCVIWKNIPEPKQIVTPKNSAWDNYDPNKKIIAEEKKSDMWLAPSMELANNELNAKQILYGRELIANTSKYLGPNGTVAHISNGMNCQNCHLDAGTKVFGNNYGGVYSTYPKFRERSGSVENIYKRVNDCFERSLNGSALDTNSKEMQAIYAYIKFLGRDVKKKEKPKGSGITELAYLKRAADPEKGKKVFESKCISCHGRNGEGLMNADGIVYTYPPLWGDHSYNNGAGLFRLSRFAGYVKANMPQGATFENPQLTDEEAWDVAAFVNSQPRPTKDQSKDWPNKKGKPVDHPFGPYADKFSEQQHKFGPFEEIAQWKKKNAGQNNSL
jgi:thiosulfate dehydrogenase